MPRKKPVVLSESAARDVLEILHDPRRRRRGAARPRRGSETQRALITIEFDVDSDGAEALAMLSTKSINPKFWAQLFEVILEGGDPLVAISIECPIC